MIIILGIMLSRKLKNKCSDIFLSDQPVVKQRERRFSGFVDQKHFEFWMRMLNVNM